MRLRELKIKDAEGMLEWMHDPDIQSCFHANMTSKTMRDVEGFIEKAEYAPVHNCSIHYAITDDNDEYMGTISLKRIDLEAHNAEYAISLRQCARGKGIGKSATIEILRIAFEEFGLERVYLNVLSDNTKAIGMYETVGFVYEGEVTIGGEEWETFTFNAPYEYSGTKNLVIAVSSENTVNMNLKWNKFAEATAKPTLHNTSAGSEPSNVTSVKGYRPVIKLTTTGGGGTTPEPGEGDDDEEPTTLAAPVVAATALSATEIKLEWEAVADTATYQIYFEDENIGTTKETSFVVVNCNPETQVCCTVVAELGDLKSEASEPACATTLAEGEEPEPVDPVLPGEPTTVFIGENGEFASYYSPIYDYYSKYAITQQIYTAEEIGIASGEITSIAFKSKSGGGYDRNISVYLSNTDKEYYTGGMDWVVLTEADAAVFEGTITTPTNGEWLTIELTTPFEYTGGNLAVTINDKTGSYGEYAQFIQWEAYSTGKSETSPRALYKTNYNSEIAYTGLATIYGTLDAHNYAGWGETPDNEYINSKVKFTIIPSASNVEVPEAVSLGKVLLADYWSEKTSTKVSVKAINTTISNITVDNDFFVLPSEIDYTANTVTFDLSYNRNAEVSGDVNGTITVTYAEGTKTFPVTATVYTPVQPDVFELAEEVVFTENAYTQISSGSAKRSIIAFVSSSVRDRKSESASPSRKNGPAMIPPPSRCRLPCIPMSLASSLPIRIISSPR